MPHRVLFIEEAPFSLGQECGSGLDLIPEFAPWASALPHRVREHAPDLIVAVAASGVPSVHDFFEWLANTPVGVPSLAVLPATDELVRAAAKAVDDFIISPFRSIELRHRMARLLGEADEVAKTALHERLTRELALRGLVGKHREFLRTIEQIPVVAAYGTPILIIGETGTGKELCARAIHHLSARRHYPFIPVDCGALPEHLFESEMFGHTRGAFTDAHRDHKGLAALAGEGTLFLDEVDSLPFSAQSKVLRLLQERSYRPVGSERFVPTGARIIAACNQDLKRLVVEKKFRSDLFFRLNVLRMQLAPLRERRSDIPLLARHFLETLAVEHGTSRKQIGTALLQVLMAYDWPGNVRELYNTLQRAVIFCPGVQIQLEHMPDLPAAQSKRPVNVSFREARTHAVTTFERSYIDDMLRQAAGNVTLAARLAGKDRRVFGRLMKRHNISRDLI